MSERRKKFALCDAAHTADGSSMAIFVFRVRLTAGASKFPVEEGLCHGNAALSTAIVFGDRAVGSSCDDRFWPGSLLPASSCPRVQATAPGEPYSNRQSL